MNDAIDQRRQLAQRLGLLVAIGVPIINARDARNRVAQNALGVIGR